MRATRCSRSALGRIELQEILGRVDVDCGARHRHAHDAVTVTPEQHLRPAVSAQLEQIAEINRLLDERGIVLDCDPRKVTQSGAGQKEAVKENNA